MIRQDVVVGVGDDLRLLVDDPIQQRRTVPCRRIEPMMRRPKRLQRAIERRDRRTDHLMHCLRIMRQLREKTETPIAAPRLRSRLNNDAPSVRIDGASVTKAST